MKKYFTLLLCLISICTYSQTDKDILDIRAEYNKIKAIIPTLNEKGQEGEYYCNFSSYNCYNKSWPGTGLSIDNIWLYYKFDEDGMPEICFVSSNSQHAALVSESEWLFRDGKIIFVYMDGSYDYLFPRRFYFKDDKLIKYLEDKNETSPDDKQIKDIFKKVETIKETLKRDLIFDL